MKYLIEQCIFPIIDGNECVGQGFIADGYFLTAAHIIERNPECFIELGEYRLKLKSITPIYIGHGDFEKDPNSEDVVIYVINQTTSFLHLSVREPLETDILKTVHIALNHDAKTNQYHKDLVVWGANYTGQKEGNYFYCKCHSYEGCSGGPLIIGNEIVGIVHGGNNDGLCAFFKLSTFLLPEGTYNGTIIRNLESQPQPEEPLTPAYFNRIARKQINDAFE